MIRIVYETWIMVLRGTELAHQEETKTPFGMASPPIPQVVWNHFGGKRGTTVIEPSNL